MRAPGPAPAERVPAAAAHVATAPLASAWRDEAQTRLRLLDQLEQRARGDDPQPLGRVDDDHLQRGTGPRVCVANSIAARTHLLDL